MRGKELIQSVVRAMDILECVSRGPAGCRLADVSEELHLNATTAYNLMRTLTERGFLCKGPSNRYRLGPAFKELAQHETRNRVMTVARRELLRISSEMPDCVAGLAELCGSQIRVVLRVSPDRARTVTAPLAFPLPVYTSGTGLCFLMQSVYAPGLLRDCSFEEYGMSRWKTREELAEFLRECRERGFVHLELDGGEFVALAEPVGENMALNIRSPRAAAKQAIALLHECAGRIRSEG